MKNRVLGGTVQGSVSMLPYHVGTAASALKGMLHILVTVTTQPLMVSTAIKVSLYLKHFSLPSTTCNCLRSKFFLSKTLEPTLRLDRG